MKILLMSNSPAAATGYGGQVATFAPLFQEAGHDIAIFAFYGIQGAVLGWNCPKTGRSFQLYGCHVNQFGDDVVLNHAANHFGGDVKDGLILMLIDVWVYNAAQFTRTNTASWCPVDHYPVPPAVREFFEVSGARPIAMSRFGEKALREAKLDPLYVPHGIDTEVFTPKPRKEAREALGISEDAFLVGMVAANKGNPSRKGISQAFTAFKVIHGRHPEAKLYLHTELSGVMNGVNIPAIAQAHDIPSECLVAPDQYRYVMGGFHTEYMTLAYSAMDVLLNPAYGEGFGIPIVEAQACGTPVAVTDWTAMSELCGAGWLLQGDPVFTNQNSFWKVPYVESIVNALEDAYTKRGDQALRDEARKFALQYDARKVMDEFWTPVLGQIEAEIAPLEVPAELVAA